MGRRKGSYFSVRFSAALLERLETARVELYGERTSLAETIRRLLEERLSDLSRMRAQPGGTEMRIADMQEASVPSMPMKTGGEGISNQKLGHAEHLASGHLLAAEIAQVALAVDLLVQRSVELGAKEVSVRPPSITENANTTHDDSSVEVLGTQRRSL